MSIETGFLKLSDLWLLGKKIAVGLLITVVPVAILGGGLWIAQKMLESCQPATTNSAELSHANGF